MNCRILFRFLLILGISLVGRLHVDAAKVELNVEPDVLVGNGIGANGGGLLDGIVGFTTNVVTTNANDVDRAVFSSTDSFVRTWIDDTSSNQVDWSSTFTFDFSQPISGLRIISEMAVNTSDTVVYNIRWNGSSSEAAFVNSPDVLNEHSIYVGGSRLAHGTYTSGTVFRLDDDGSAGQNPNGSIPNDLNLSKPTTPWTFALPDDITSLTIQAVIADGAVINRAYEGLAVDFSAVSIVPEPSNLAIQLLVLTALFFRRR